VPAALEKKIKQVIAQGTPADDAEEVARKRLGL
jgi:hypothetical protein